MTTNNVVSMLADKWLPLPVEKFFTAQRAPDMWFSDELPPTVQALMHSPMIVQAKQAAAMQLYQQLMVKERNDLQRAEMKRRKVARSRIGKRAKSSRH